MMKISQRAIRSIFISNMRLKTLLKKFEIVQTRLASCSKECQLLEIQIKWYCLPFAVLHSCFRSFILKQTNWRHMKKAKKQDRRTSSIPVLGRPTCSPFSFIKMRTSQTSNFSLKIRGVFAEAKETEKNSIAREAKETFRCFRFPFSRTFCCFGDIHDLSERSLVSGFRYLLSAVP